MFRNSDIPNNIVRLAKLKLPRIIEIISNAPKHIIDQMIENYNKKKSENEITKYGEEKISQYYLLNEIINIKPFNINQTQKILKKF